MPLDIDEEEDLEEDVKKGGKKIWKILFVFLIVLLLAGGISGGTLYFTGFWNGADKIAKAEVDEKKDKKSKKSKKNKKSKKSQKRKKDKKKKGNKKGKKKVSKNKASKSKGPKKRALYFPLKPEFTVNFENTQSASYLQVAIQVMAREQDALDDVEHHMPAIRNSVLLLLGSQTFEKVNTHVGKEKLRKSVLKTIQKILKSETGKTGIEDVYFTSIIMQ